MTSGTSEAWSAAAGLYVSRTALVTVVPAQRLITMTHEVSPFHLFESHVLDNGAGIGVLTKALVDQFPGIRILATDTTPAILAELEKNNCTMSRRR